MGTSDSVEKGRRVEMTPGSNWIYAVTVSGSMYALLNARELRKGTPVPIGRRVAVKHHRRSGPKRARCFTQGFYAGLTRKGIILYDIEPHADLGCPPRPEEAREQWREWTSPLVALFLNKKDAIRCLRHDQLRECDPRWWKQTLDTIETVEACPLSVILVAKEPGLGFQQRGRAAV